MILIINKLKKNLGKKKNWKIGVNSHNYKSIIIKSKKLIIYG